eukprot:CAMPEP_0182454068 /NCGR_PEP_ID=MMETSP1319-20130603/859_1 /TAXON_ID=172717 /ORGANISM="Bolidomonas pacifica, Strain RCC208" /LENGTH=169 /DNA_ID=CAMNT_0024652039 /DNA_START=46 /DNA_END=555 /DNA_ORIENTATION=-
MTRSSIYAAHEKRHILLRKTFPNHNISSVPLENYHSQDLHRRQRQVRQNLEELSSPSTPSTAPRSPIPHVPLVCVGTLSLLARMVSRAAPGSQGWGFSTAGGGVSGPPASASKLSRPLFAFASTPAGRVASVVAPGIVSGAARSAGRAAVRSAPVAGGLALFAVTKTFF